MKKTHYLISITATALFSSAGYAGVDDNQDLMYGNVRLASSDNSPYVMKHNGPKGIEQDLIYGSVDIGTSDSQPYERSADERDNRDDILSNV